MLSSNMEGNRYFLNHLILLTETSLRAIERNARMSTRPSNARVPQQNVSNVYIMVKLTLLAMSSPQLTARYG